MEQKTAICEGKAILASLSEQDKVAPHGLSVWRRTHIVARLHGALACMRYPGWGSPSALLEEMKELAAELAANDFSAYVSVFHDRRDWLEKHYPEPERIRPSRIGPRVG